MPPRPAGRPSQKLAVADDGKYYITAVEAVLAEHLPAAGDSGGVQLVDVVYLQKELKLGRNITLRPVIALV